MRVLYLSTGDPGDFTSGGAQRNSIIQQAMQEVASVDTIISRGEDLPVVQSEWNSDRTLKIATSHNPSWFERLRAFVATSRLIRRALRETKYDFIVARHFSRAMPVPFKMHGKLIIDADDLNRSPVGKPLVKRLVLRLRAQAIRHLSGRAHHVWLVDPRDVRALDRSMTNCSTLPNTARAPAGLARNNLGPGCRLLMVGFFSYPPNEEGLVWLARNVIPQLVVEFPRIELHAVGNYYQRYLADLSPHVQMRGFVDDLDGEYASSDVVVCPIISGSGTQIKVIEALMHCKPTVVSDFSYQGFADVLRPDKHLLVAGDPDEWILQIGKILRDPSNFREMARSGHQAATSEYNETAFREKVIRTLSD